MPSAQPTSESTKSPTVPNVEDVLNELESKPANVFKIFSGPGAHYLHQFDGILFAVYAGPHGPENRPARVDEETLNQLLQVAERAKFVDLDQSPFSETWL